MRKAGKLVFLCTSSNESYANLILENILVDQKTGQPDDYWKYFDICFSDARKPILFTETDPFVTQENLPVEYLECKNWYAQGKI